MYINKARMNRWRFEPTTLSSTTDHQFVENSDIIKMSILWRMTSLKVYLVVLLGLLDPAPEEALPSDLGHRNGGRWVDGGRFFGKGRCGLQDVNIFTANPGKELRVAHKLKNNI